ncbi:MAG TPA: UDP-N-acetylglucosamine 2-epimerase [Gemmatimonadales bacterium]|nr:UDP-N-acetylglucosamine 2-epimerase [Gemmatimonadales bacterium]
MRGGPLQPRTVLFLTGTRADFGKLKPLILGAQAHAGLEARVFATGLHMLARYGSTVHEIEKAGCRSIYPYINQDGAISTQMDIVLANTVNGLAHFVRECRPDLLVVHGDRVEALAGGIVGALNNILVGHVEGGELSGTVDELLRHAISKLAHVHFVANDEARGRLVQMGEEPDSIFVIGSPDIDIMLSGSLPSPEEVRAKYDIPFADYVILLYHPVTTEPHTLRARTRSLLAGLRTSGRNVVALYPNNDTGAEQIIEELQLFARQPQVRLLPSMRFEYFLSLLRHADAIVGNSSAGIREAPVYGIPTVNVGTRQTDRFAGPSIVNIPEEPGAVARALHHLPARTPPSYHFGRGNSVALFLAALTGDALWARSPQKHFRDLATQAPADAAGVAV